MQLIVINKKTNKSTKLKFGKISIDKIKNVVRSVVSSDSKYSITLMAESEQDIDLVANNFHNIPLPAVPTTKAKWTGDLATFIVDNYPAT